MDQLPVSIAKLAPFVDTVITFENDDPKPGQEEAPDVIPSPAMAMFMGEECPLSLTSRAPKTMKEFRQLFRQKRRRSLTGGLATLDLPRSASFGDLAPSTPNMAPERAMVHQASAMTPNHHRSKRN
jgi:hypothetical protein